MREGEGNLVHNGWRDHFSKAGLGDRGRLLYVQSLFFKSRRDFPLFVFSRSSRSGDFANPPVRS